MLSREGCTCSVGQTCDSTKMGLSRVHSSTTSRSLMKRACGSPSKLGKVPTVRHHTSRFPQVPHPTSSSSPGKGSQTTRPLSICRVPVPVKPVQPARYWRRLRRFAVNTLPGCCVCWCRRAPARTCLQVPHRTSKILRLCPAATKWAHLTKILRPILSSDPDCFFSPPPLWLLM